jgi:hypothetical protein
MAISKLNKFILLGALLIISIIAFAIYVIENPYIDSFEIQKCDEDSQSKFVANGRPIYIRLAGYNTDEIRNTKINLIKNKNLKFYPLHINSNIYFTSDKISKQDTVLVELKDNKIKLYDFIYEGEEIKAGQFKGHYSCELSYIEEGVRVYSTLDTIYINK